MLESRPGTRAERLELLDWLHEQGFSIAQMVEADAYGGLAALVGDRVLVAGPLMSRREAVERSGLDPARFDGLSNAPLSALTRGLEAVVTAGVLAFGMLAGASLGVGFGLTYTPNTEAEPILLGMLAAGFAVLGLAIAWGMPRDQLLPSAALGAFGWLIVVIVPGDDTGLLVTAIAAIAVGFAGALLSTVQQTPASVYIGVAILPLVPGYTLYQGMLAVAQGKHNVAADALTEAVFISVAIAVGVAVGLAIGRNTTRIGGRARAAWRTRETRALR